MIKLMAGRRLPRAVTGGELARRHPSAAVVDAAGGVARARQAAAPRRLARDQAVKLLSGGAFCLLTAHLRLIRVTLRSFTQDNLYLSWP